MKILLISGHGAGDSGAVGCGYKEADLTRQATYLLEGKLNAYDCTVTRYPTSRNAYEDNKNGKSIAWTEYGLVVEVHYNSFNSSAKGTETLYKPDSMKALAQKVTTAIAAVGFVNRGAKQRFDLMNMNTCARLGVPYILIETCFIDSKSDMTTYNEHRDAVWHAVAKAICDHYGIKKLASGGGDAVRWVKENGKWYFYDDGKMVKSKWVKWKGEWYYLKSDGQMAENTWQKDATGKWCYLGSDGKMVKSAWVKSKGVWYYLKSDGYMADAEWIQYKNNWYYLKPGGAMATGKVNVPCEFDKDGKWVK